MSREIEVSGHWFVLLVLHITQVSNKSVTQAKAGLANVDVRASNALNGVHQVATDARKPALNRPNLLGEGYRGIGGEVSAGFASGPATFAAPVCVRDRNAGRQTTSDQNVAQVLIPPMSHQWGIIEDGLRLRIVLKNFVILQNDTFDHIGVRVARNGQNRPLAFGTNSRTSGSQGAASGHETDLVGRLLEQIFRVVSSPEEIEGLICFGGKIIVIRTEPTDTGQLCKGNGALALKGVVLN